jgi:hypothetical protein
MMLASAARPGRGAITERGTRLTITPSSRRLLAGAVPLLAVTALAVPAAQAAPVPVGTLPAWDGQNAVFAYGPDQTHTYGQVVTAPAGATTLREFALELSLPTDVVSRAEVYAWDGEKATGPALYESAPFSTTVPPVDPANPGVTQFQLASFAIPDAPVVAGQQYVLFLSVNRDITPSSTGSGVFGAVPDETYADGQYVYSNDQTVADWTTQPWDGGIDDGYAGDYDLAFRATFDDGVVPTTPAPTAPATPVLTPTPPVAPPPLPVPPARDTTSPRITGVRVSPHQVRFRLSEPGAARVFISKRVVRRTGTGSARRSVVSYRRVNTLSVTKRYAGVASVRFSKGLTDGRYRVSITARDAAGNAAKPVRVYTKP